MSDPNGVVLHPMHGPGLEAALSALGQVSVVVPEDGDGVVSALESGARALVTYRWEDRFAVDGLEWIQAISAGLEQFPQDLLAERGIVLTSAKGAHTPAVAEHAIALMMAVVRMVGSATAGRAERVWRPLPAYEVGGRTMGILGLGSIGEAIAVKASALGMEVIGTKRDPATYEGVATAVYPAAATREVCRASDVLMIALPEHASTRHSVGAGEFDALGDGWLVNVGRGSVVDEPALVAALASGRLRGAGLDVTATEPLPPSSPLWDLPNVVVTPHMGWSSDRLAGRLADLWAANARAWLHGAEWVNRVV